MATLQIPCFGLPPKRIHETVLFSVSVAKKPFVFSRISTLTSSPTAIHHLNLKHTLKASSEEISSDLIEESKFVPLNTDDPKYGPPALLLLGFEVEEATKIQQLLKELDGEFLEIIYCTKSMINGSLWDAMNTKQPDLKAVKIAKSLPRICFLSGLTGEEMIMFIDAFPEAGLEDAVFAALVPNSAEKPVQELIDEIMVDHEMMSSQQAAST